MSHIVVIHYYYLSLEDSWKGAIFQLQNLTLISTTLILLLRVIFTCTVLKKSLFLCLEFRELVITPHHITINIVLYISVNKKIDKWQSVCQTSDSFLSLSLWKKIGIVTTDCPRPNRYHTEKNISPSSLFHQAYQFLDRYFAEKKISPSSLFLQEHPSLTKQAPGRESFKDDNS